MKGQMGVRGGEYEVASEEFTGLEERGITGYCSSEMNEIAG